MSSFKIDMRNDFEAVVTGLSREIRRSVENIRQRVITKAAQEVKAAEEAQMRVSFDNPNRFTLNALTTKFDRQRMEARVEVKDGYWSRADNYLDTQIVGSPSRKHKAFERALHRAGVLPAGWLAVPGQAARIDAFGNMSVGQIKQIMSWFDAAEPYRGSTQNMGQKGREKKRAGTRSKRGFEFFVAMRGHRIGRRSWMHGRTQNLEPGIYQRTFFGFGASIKPVLIFVQAAKYQKRYPFYETAAQTLDRVGDQLVADAIERELSR